MSFANTVVSLLSEAVHFDVDRASVTEMRTGLRTLIEYFFVSSLNARLYLGFCYKVKQPNQCNLILMFFFDRAS